MRVAAIDIGTNTVLLLIAELGAGGKLVPIVDLAEITRLGQGVDRARSLLPEAVARTLDCLRHYADEIARSGVARVDVVGTSALRDVTGGKSSVASEFIEHATRILGVAPRVISGDEEASLAFSGGLVDLGLSGPVTAFDIGGGSTEVMSGTVLDDGVARGARPEAKLEERRSLDVGSVRLFERHVRNDPPTATEMSAIRAFVRGQLLTLPPAPRNVPLVGMAGTVTTMAAIARSIDPYDPVRVHGLRLPAAEIAETARRLGALSLNERKTVRGLEPKRADVIPVGAVLVESILEWSRAEEIIVSDRGVRWGLALNATKAVLGGGEAR